MSPAAKASAATASTSAACRAAMIMLAVIVAVLAPPVQLSADKGLDLAFGYRAHEAVHRLAVLEGIDGGNRLDAQLLGDLRILVDIDLDQLHRALGVVDRFFQRGPSCLQGPHQGAQKSTITGTSRLASSTSAAKVARPESLICGLGAGRSILRGCGGDGPSAGSDQCHGAVSRCVWLPKDGHSGLKRKPVAAHLNCRESSRGRPPLRREAPGRGGAAARSRACVGRTGFSLLRHQLLDPVRQRERRGMDLRIVIVGLELRLL